MKINLSRFIPSCLTGARHRGAGNKRSDTVPESSKTGSLLDGLPRRQESLFLNQPVQVDESEVDTHASEAQSLSMPTFPTTSMAIVQKRARETALNQKKLRDARLELTAKNNLKRELASAQRFQQKIALQQKQIEKPAVAKISEETQHPVVWANSLRLQQTYERARLGR